MCDGLVHGVVYIVLQVKELQKYYSDIPEVIDLVRKCLQVTAVTSSYITACSYIVAKLKFNGHWI